MAKRETNREQLEFFGGKFAVAGFFARRFKLFGIEVPVAGAAIVVMLMMIALTVWGILFTRAPATITDHIEHQYPVSDPQFLRSMSVLLGPPLLPGNNVQELINGDQIFPAMLAGIRSARKSITFESYIFWSGTNGKAFSQALAERARAGVKVRVLLDWAGSHKADQDGINEMGRAGAQIIKFHKPQWYRFRQLNQRTHRKLLIIDGKGRWS